MMRTHRAIRLLPLLLLAAALMFPAFSSCKKDLSLKRNKPRNIHGVANFGRAFNDRNDKQLDIAHAIGIAPLGKRADAEKLADSLRLVATCEHYSVDSLTYSIPYLIPGGAMLLDCIGSNFLDSLRSKGLNPYKVIVTSVLRTAEDVRRLRRRNFNAVKASAHSYGTTFDISWKRFEKVEDEDGRPLEDVRADTLKLVLAEVLRDLKNEGKCYVKYETRQACFHITTRQ